MSFDPGKYDFTILRNSTFRRKLTWKDQTGTLVNLTGWTGALTAQSFIIGQPPLFDLTTENGGMTLGGVAGSIDLFMNKTATLSLPPCAALYDLLLNSPIGDEYYLLYGKVTIQDTITRNG